MGLALASVSPFLYHWLWKGGNMSWIDQRKYADKFIALFSDNKVMPSEWKHSIPLYIVQQPITVAINAKNFADGIQYNLELYGVEIPPEKLAKSEYSKDFLIH